MKVDCHIEMVNWKQHVCDSQRRMFDKITPLRSGGEQYRETRMLLNVAMADVIYYIIPDKREIILSTVTRLLNDKVAQLREADPRRFGGSRVSLVGHSLGSVIINDILDQDPSLLDFKVDRFFLWGSPLAVFLSVADGPTESRFGLPHRMDVYNIFHPHDPVAFRLDPLITGDDLEEPLVLPHWDNSELRSVYVEGKTSFVMTTGRPDSGNAISIMLKGNSQGRGCR